MPFTEIANRSIWIDVDAYARVRDELLPQGQNIIDFVTVKKGWFPPQQQWYWYPALHDVSLETENKRFETEACLLELTDDHRKIQSKPYVISYEIGPQIIGQFGSRVYAQGGMFQSSELLLTFQRFKLETGITPFNLFSVQFIYRYEDHGTSRVVVVEKTNTEGFGGVFSGTVDQKNWYDMQTIAIFQGGKLEVEKAKWLSFLPPVERLARLDRHWVYEHMPRFLPGGDLESITDNLAFERAVFGMF